MILSKRDRNRLVGTKQDLVDVIVLAAELTKQDFAIIQGLRTPQQQAINVANGVSQTVHSKHLDGSAIDIAALMPNDKLDWNTISKYIVIAQAFQTD